MRKTFSDKDEDGVSRGGMAEPRENDDDGDTGRGRSETWTRRSYRRTVVRRIGIGTHDYAPGRMVRGVCV